VACAQLWIAGVDVPEIDAVIWLRPTASLTAWLQGNGRGLRIAPGKRDLLVLDHVGNCARLGHPLTLHEWSLDGRMRSSREAAPSIRICPRCFSAMPSAKQVCPDCGHEFVAERREIETVDGELEEVQRREAKREQAQANTLDELIAIGRRRNMKNPAGWARHVMAARSLRSGKARVREVV
jgi:superfamily II DNA or RNA helicase